MSKKYEDVLFDMEFSGRYAFVDCLKQLRVGNDQALIPYLEKHARGLHDALLEVTTVDATKMDVRVLRSLNQILGTILTMHPDGKPVRPPEPSRSPDPPADPLGDSPDFTDNATDIRDDEDD